MPDLIFNEHAGGLQSGIPRLKATRAAPLSFLPGFFVRSFVLERPQGNVIVYNSPALSDAAPAVRGLGDPQRLLLNHHHEAMCGMPDLDVPVWVHERDLPKVAMPIAGTFSERQMIDDDLEIIPIPGHTLGATAFLWDNGTHRCLFPGDSLWVKGGTWRAVPLAESDRSAYVESLSLMADLDFDLLLPWGGEEGAPYGYVVSKEQARAGFDQALAQLTADGRS
ncbi:hypothetical protein PVT71_20060 [Salipiger sp. H15]|uniref:Metallo-beta-lactamase domain-containing protein n=1 Tax=Alloyangia sp. H15 TaxID=3029062 RepID=A0AAU8AKA3_9RHOB